MKKIYFKPETESVALVGAYGICSTSDPLSTDPSAPTPPPAPGRKFVF